LHVSGMWSVVEHLLHGRRICLLEQFEPVEWSRVVSAYKPRMAMLSPPVIRMILDAEIPKENLASLKGVTSGTAPLSPALERQFEKLYDIPVLPAYGATEFPGRGAGWTLEDHEHYGESKIGSVGRARPGVKLRIVDTQSGQPVAIGEIGLIELFARTAATLDGEEPKWLRTTDLAFLDEDDFLWIKGRADAAIIRGGFKILPEDVVAVLEQHPDVLEASVVGLSDSRLGQVPAAAIVPRSGANPISVEDLMAHARKYLTAYQVPAVFKLVDEMPRTQTLKISMPAVKALFAANKDAE
jgi:long-chain acyl-CoA synthetase